jgi:hypothetical protein
VEHTNLDTTGPEACRPKSFAEVRSASTDPLPSDDDVAFYQQHGWFATARVLDDRLLDEALEGLRQHWAGHRDAELPGGGERFADWMPGAGEGTRNNEYLSLQNHRVRKLALSPIIGAIAGRLTGSSAIRLFDDQMVFKPGGQKDSAVGWHVDGDYWLTCSSQQMLTAWIPLHDCPDEMGPLVILDRSHAWSHQIERSRLSFRQQDMDGFAGRVRELGYEFTPVMMNLRRGQISFHHCRAIHGSYPNRGESPRIALAVHLQDADNNYRPSIKPDGRPVILFNDMICLRTDSGMPDYSDDAVFPLLWQAPDDMSKSLKSKLL